MCVCVLCVCVGGDAWPCVYVSGFRLQDSHPLAW